MSGVKFEIQKCDIWSCDGIHDRTCQWETIISESTPFKACSIFLDKINNDEIDKQNNYFKIKQSGRGRAPII